MGSGIACVALISGFDVVLCDVAEAAARKAVERIRIDLEKAVTRKELSAEQSAESLKHLTTARTLAELSGCNAVVEAAAENIEVKGEIFSALGSICAPSTLLLSNTSSLSITSIAAYCTEPGRVAGMHFFNPPQRMKLVEIVSGHRTSPATASAAGELARAMGKTPVFAKDTPGFIVNRVARPFYGEALRLLGEGVATMEEIDRIVKLEGEFKMGPFELMDLIGIDINLAVTKSIYEQTFHEPRYRPHLIQQTMVNAGMLGRKTKRGFYTYEE
jgi:3-hydroxybutyryl-CoA dehydrogenase